MSHRDPLQSLLSIRDYLRTRRDHLSDLMDKGTGAHGYAKQSLGASRDEVEFTLDFVEQHLPPEPAAKSPRKPGR